MVSKLGARYLEASGQQVGRLHAISFTPTANMQSDLYSMHKYLINMITHV